MENIKERIILEHKSLNWDKVEEEIKNLALGQRLPGYPFDEGFPIMYIGREYEVYLFSGKKFFARVDNSDKSKGLQWKVTGVGKFPKTSVAAWKELSDSVLKNS